MGNGELELFSAKYPGIDIITYQAQAYYDHLSWGKDAIPCRNWSSLEAFPLHKSHLRDKVTLLRDTILLKTILWGVPIMAQWLRNP